MSLLRNAREYRTLLDYKASHQPYDCATLGFGGGAVRVALHGAASLKVAIPDGTKPVEDFPLLSGLVPASSDWLMLAPDEDKVLTALAVQLNAIFPSLSAQLTEAKALEACTWQLVLGERPAAGVPDSCGCRRRSSPAEATAQAGL